MASPSYTYTLTNGTTADATQVMQNFADLLNGITDGTKDISVAALTAAGTATLNGHVNLGNAAADDLSITASLASSIGIKTTNSYDIGSATKGLASVYFGTGDTDTARIVSASLAASRTYTLPDAGAAADFVMTAGAQTIAGAKSLTGQLSVAASQASDYVVKLENTRGSAATDWGTLVKVNTTASTKAFTVANTSNDLFNVDGAGAAAFGPSGTTGSIGSDGRFQAGLASGTISPHTIRGVVSSGGLTNHFSTAASDSAFGYFTVIKTANDSTTSQVFCKFLINGAAAACGQINANGANTAAFGSTSDERLKENITDLPSQLDNIMGLRPVEFDYKDGTGHQIGFIAQEMQAIYPDVVGENSDGFLTITGWSKTESRLVKALQELKQQFDAYVLAHH